MKRVGLWILFAILILAGTAIEMLRSHPAASSAAPATHCMWLI
jgi:hypothetical protein